MAFVCWEAFNEPPKNKNVFEKMNSTLTLVVPYSKAFKNDWVCKIGKPRKGEKRNLKSDNFKSYVDWGLL